MKIVYRFSYLSVVLSDHKNKVESKHSLETYLSGTSFTWLKDFDFSKLPDDYNGDNYDLIFNENLNFIKAEKDLNETHKLK